MKSIQVLIVLSLTLSMCCLVAGVPDITGLTTEECLVCHADERGNTVKIHHETYDAVNNLCTVNCHQDMSLPDGWRECNYCHIDFNHHEDVQGRCSDCHEDRQPRKMR